MKGVSDRALRGLQRVKGNNGATRDTMNTSSAPQTCSFKYVNNNRRHYEKNLVGTYFSQPRSIMGQSMGQKELGALHTNCGKNF